MATYVITVIGDEQVGLVQSLADAVSRAGGNWERSEMAELAGKFAGLVQVTLPDDRADELADNLEGLEGLEISVQKAEAESTVPEDSVAFRLELVGNDKPGIIQEITTALRGHGVTIERLESTVTDAPWHGGQLFECKATLRGPEVRMGPVKTELERIAGELMVDLNLGV
ncbi:glycine cleavage system protein R [Granulicoccus sp. GXG6511]|uniref:glycine cleavage system protein R n=1 Tax=Granulicoccus sp. GXG6511 TaxID=3381351 RepID=UPI003D7C576A